MLALCIQTESRLSWVLVLGVFHQSAINPNIRSPLEGDCKRFAVPLSRGERLVCLARPKL